MKALEPNGLNLLEQMLVYDPSRRISAKKVLLPSTHSSSPLSSSYLLKQLSSTHLPPSPPPPPHLTPHQALQHPYFDDLDKTNLPAKPGEYDVKF